MRQGGIRVEENPTVKKTRIGLNSVLCKGRESFNFGQNREFMQNGLEEVFGTIVFGCDADLYGKAMVGVHVINSPLQRNLGYK